MKESSTQPASTYIKDGNVAVQLAHKLVAQKEEIDFYKEMADINIIPTFIGDLDGKVTYANNAYLLLLDQPIESVLGFGWCNSVVAEDSSSVKLAWIEAAASNSNFVYKVRYLTPAGTTIDTNVRATLLPSAKYYVGFVFPDGFSVKETLFK